MALRSWRRAPVVEADRLLFFGKHPVIRGFFCVLTTVECNLPLTILPSRTRSTARMHAWYDQTPRACRILPDDRTLFVRSRPAGANLPPADCSLARRVLPACHGVFPRSALLRRVLAGSANGAAGSEGLGHVLGGIAPRRTFFLVGQACRVIVYAAGVLICMPLHGRVGRAALSRVQTLAYVAKKVFPIQARSAPSRIVLCAAMGNASRPTDRDDFRGTLPVRTQRKSLGPKADPSERPTVRTIVQPY